MAPKRQTARPSARGYSAHQPPNVVKQEQIRDPANWLGDLDANSRNDATTLERVDITQEDAGKGRQNTSEATVNLHRPAEVGIGTKRKAQDEDGNQFTGLGVPDAELLKRFKPYGEEVEGTFCPQTITTQEAIIGVYRADEGHKRVVTGALEKTGVVVFRCRNYTSQLASIEPSRVNQERRASDRPWEMSFNCLMECVDLRGDVNLSTFGELVDYIIDQTDSKHHIFISASDLEEYGDMANVLHFLQKNHDLAKLTGTGSLSRPHLLMVANEIAGLSGSQLYTNDLGYCAKADQRPKLELLIQKQWQQSMNMLATMMKSRNGMKVASVKRTILYSDIVESEWGLISHGGMLKEHTF